MKTKARGNVGTGVAPFGAKPLAGKNPHFWMRLMNMDAPIAKPEPKITNDIRSLEDETLKEIAMNFMVKKSAANSFQFLVDNKDNLNGKDFQTLLNVALKSAHGKTREAAFRYSIDCCKTVGWNVINYDQHWNRIKGKAGKLEQAPDEKLINRLARQFSGKRMEAVVKNRRLELVFKNDSGFMRVETAGMLGVFAAMGTFLMGYITIKMAPELLERIGALRTLGIMGILGGLFAFAGFFAAKLAKSMWLDFDQKRMAKILKVDFSPAERMETESEDKTSVGLRVGT